MKHFSVPEVDGTTVPSSFTFADVFRGVTAIRADVPPEGSKEFLKRISVPSARVRMNKATFDRQLNDMVRRLLDIVLCAVALIMLAPLFLGIVIAIRATSSGPALFRQNRYGTHGALFSILKFRTMYVGRSDVSGRQQTVRDDPRVTPLGRFLRQTSFDELPQLINVLKGDMSLVGPRPHVPDMQAAGVRYEDFDARYMERHAVRPGLTGLAQIKGFRGDTSTEYAARMRLDYDMNYVAQRSVWLNIKIIFATIRVEFLNGSGY